MNKANQNQFYYSSEPQIALTISCAVFLLADCLSGGAYEYYRLYYQCAITFVCDNFHVCHGDYRKYKKGITPDPLIDCTFNCQLHSQN